MTHELWETFPDGWNCSALGLQLDIWHERMLNDSNLFFCSSFWADFLQVMAERWRNMCLTVKLSWREGGQRQQQQQRRRRRRRRGRRRRLHLHRPHGDGHCQHDLSMVMPPMSGYGWKRFPYLASTGTCLGLEKRSRLSGDGFPTTKASKIDRKWWTTLASKNSASSLSVRFEQNPLLFTVQDSRNDWREEWASIRSESSVRTFRDQQTEPERASERARDPDRDSDGVSCCHSPFELHEEEWGFWLPTCALLQGGRLSLWSLFVNLVSINLYFVMDFFLTCNQNIVRLRKSCCTSAQSGHHLSQWRQPSVAQPHRENSMQGLWNNDMFSGLVEKWSLCEESSFQ